MKELIEEYRRRCAELEKLKAEAKKRGIDLNGSDADDSSIERLMKEYGIVHPLASSELDAAEINTTYLVDQVLVDQQPATIAGPSKSMKTTFAIDLTLSLATGKKFLDRFAVAEPKRVLFLSAESGEGTIQETARRIAGAKWFKLETDSNAFWGFWVPRAKNAEMMQILEYQLDRFKPAVCIIDPLYMVLDGEDQANLSLNGQQINEVNRRCLSRGITPILVDHVKRSSVNASAMQPLELNDITGAGKAESVRQWLLINRREKFDPETPLHRLWMSVGGSAGHCGCFAVDADESRGPGGKRIWAVEVRLASEAINQDVDRRQAAAAAAKERKRQTALAAHVRKLRQAFDQCGPAGESKSSIFSRAGLNATNGQEALSHLLNQGIVEPCILLKNKREIDGFRLTDQGRNDEGDFGDFGFS